MSKLWIIEALTGPNNKPAGRWVPTWNAFEGCSALTRNDCFLVLRRQSALAETYAKRGIYTKFRIAKYVRAA